MLSIIVPVYRVEAYLDRCVESIIAQALDDWELILVDDGSPDRCPAMCDAWVQRNPHIRTIHKPNGGLSSARNAGLDTARGEYITFVDSDDALAPDTLRPNLDYLLCHPEADLVQYPTLWLWYSIPSRVAPPEQDIVSPQTIAQAFLSEVYTNSACNKIYRSYLRPFLTFADGYFYEDTLMQANLIRHLHHVHISSRGSYLYYENASSLQHIPNPKNAVDIAYAHIHRVGTLIDLQAPIEQIVHLWAGAFCKLSLSWPWPCKRRKPSTPPHNSTTAL
ncbi:MAG: glycosyltransferase [Bacteroidales bacterium]|nr:glycosyltransferase [Bacteroidales bacterium]